MTAPGGADAAAGAAAARAGAVPVVETDRLRLRGWTSADASAYVALTADPEVMRHLGGPLDAADGWRQAAMHAGAWALLGFGQWVVERKADGAFLGRAGLWEPIDHPATEVGWTFAREHWGYGYATEAARASVAWAWTALDLEELISLIAPDNAPSQAVARRLGMRRDDRLVVRGKVADRWVLPRPI